uniref:TVP38/TMEM64 family protein n=1 Tax=uncultured Dialister sp. TaxID=278064 RepID=UPI0025E5E9DF
LVFWLARVLGQRFVERLVNQRVADKYLEVIRRKRDIFLILVFLFPFFPDDLICILAGLTDIPLHRFFLIVLLTRPWGLLVACALGGSVLTIPVWAMLLLGAFSIALKSFRASFDKKIPPVRLFFHILSKWPGQVNLAQGNALLCRFVKQIGRRIRKEKASQAVS